MIFFYRSKPSHHQNLANQFDIQGMLDIALLTANASQLKYVLQVKIEAYFGKSDWFLIIQNVHISMCQVGEEHQFYTVLLILIVTSIIFQVLNYINPSF